MDPSIRMALFSLFVLCPELWREMLKYFDKMLLMYGNALLVALGIGVMASTAVPDELMTSYLNTAGATLAYNYAPCVPT